MTTNTKSPSNTGLDSAASQATESKPAVAGENPFVGPRPMHRDDRIFGRAREIRELFYLLTAERIVWLYSPSGAGKTSLVQAGLAKKLIKDGFEVWPTIRVNAGMSSRTPAGAEGAPNRYVLSTLASLENHQLKASKKSTKMIALRHVKLHEYVANRREKGDRNANIVLIFDQFEEILTVDPLDQTAKTEFFRQLGETLKQPDVWALFTLREDFLAPMDPYVHLIPTHRSNNFRLDLLTLAAARQAITKTALLGDREFAPEAADHLLGELSKVQVQQADGSFAECQGDYVEPIMLQVVCYRAWTTMRSDDLVIDPEDLGNVTRALAEYYDSALAKKEVSGDDVHRQANIRDWFDQHLIQGRIRSQVRRGKDTSGDLANEIIDELRKTHLIRAETRAGATWYELAHDRLIAPVETSNRLWRVLNLQPVALDARNWHEDGRKSKHLYGRQQLTKSQAIVSASPNDYSDLVREFLQEGMEEVKASRRRRLFGAFLIVIPMLAALTAFGFWFSYVTRDQLMQATASNMSLIAPSLVDRQYDLALLLNVQASRIAESKVVNDVRERLRAVLGAKPRLKAYLHHCPKPDDAKSACDKNPVIGLEFSPDDKELITKTKKGVHRWNLTNRRLLAKPGAAKPWGAAEPPEATTTMTPTVRTGCTTEGIDDADCQSFGLWIRWAPDSDEETLLDDESVKLSAAITTDGKILAVGRRTLGSDNQPELVDDASELFDVELWQLDLDSPRQNPLRLGRHERGVTSVVAARHRNPERVLIVTGDGNGNVYLWGASGGQGARFRLKGKSPKNAKLHSGAVQHLDLRWDGDDYLLASGGSEGSVHLQEIKAASFDFTSEHDEHDEHDERLTGLGGAIRSLALGHHGKTLAIGGEGGKVTLWYASRPFGELDGQPVLERVSEQFDGILQVAFSLDANSKKPLMGLSGSGRTPVQVFNYPPPTADELAPESDATAILIEPTEATGPVHSLAFSPVDPHFAVGDDSGQVRLWSITDSSVGEPLEVGGDLGTTPVESVVWSSDGRRLAVGFTQGSLHLWQRQAAGNYQLRDWVEHAHEGELESLAFQPCIVQEGGRCPDGLVLATGGDKGLVHLWNADTLDKPIPLEGHVGPVLALAFSPDGRYLASADRSGVVRLWLRTESKTAEVGSGGGGKTEDGHGDDRISGNPVDLMGARAATETEPPADVATTSTESPKANPEASTEAPGASTKESEASAVEPQGNDEESAAKTSANSTLTTVARVTWQAIDPPLTGHGDSVRTLAFSPDGATLASAGDDRTIRLWNVSDGRPRGEPLEGHQSPIRSVAFVPGDEGLVLVSVGSERNQPGAEIWRWSLGSEELKKRACRLANRSLTRKEWIQYIHGLDPKPSAETNQLTEVSWKQQWEQWSTDLKEWHEDKEWLKNLLHQRLNPYQETCPDDPVAEPAGLISVHRLSSAWKNAVQ